jgi:hypothetical protein
MSTSHCSRHQARFVFGEHSFICKMNLALTVLDFLLSFRTCSNDDKVPMPLMTLEDTCLCAPQFSLRPNPFVTSAIHFLNHTLSPLPSTVADLSSWFLHSNHNFLYSIYISIMFTAGSCNISSIFNTEASPELLKLGLLLSVASRYLINVIIW